MGAAIAAAVYAKRAAVATEKTVQIAEDAAGGAADALSIARENADAAVRLANGQDKASQMQLKAYVAVIGAQLVVWDEGSDKPFIRLVIKNFGATPATMTNVKLTAEWFVSSDNHVNILKFDKPCSFESLPNFEIYLPVILDSTDPGIEAGRLIVMGRLEYVDIFGAKGFSNVAFQMAQKDEFHTIEDTVRLSQISNFA